VQIVNHNSRVHQQPSKKRRARRQGSIAIIAAAGIITFLGFCALSVDLGRAAVTRNKLQRACDAGALAGAQELPENPFGARQQAKKVAELNGAPLVVLNEITISDSNTTIRVPAKETIGYGFAAVFNMRQGTAVGAAVAKVEAAAQVEAGNVVPIGVTPDTLAAHPMGAQFQLNLVRQNQENLGLNEMVLFDLRDSSGKSARVMEDSVREGWPEPIKINDTATTLNAAENAQAKKFQDAIEFRLNQARSSPWFDNGDRSVEGKDMNLNSPRVMTFIITPPQAAVNGTNDALVTGFVTVYVKGISADGTKLDVMCLPPNFASNGNSSTVPITGTRFRTVRLID
jgi:Flp pilus assembly protein TadG